MLEELIFLPMFDQQLDVGVYRLEVIFVCERVEMLLELFEYRADPFTFFPS